MWETKRYNSRARKERGGRDLDTIHIHRVVVGFDNRCNRLVLLRRHALELLRLAASATSARVCRLFLLLDLVPRLLDDFATRIKVPIRMVDRISPSQPFPLGDTPAPGQFRVLQLEHARAGDVVVARFGRREDLFQVGVGHLRTDGRVEEGSEAGFGVVAERTTVDLACAGDRTGDDRCTPVRCAGCISRCRLRSGVKIPEAKLTISAYSSCVNLRVRIGGECCTGTLC